MSVRTRTMPALAAILFVPLAALAQAPQSPLVRKAPLQTDESLYGAPKFADIETIDFAIDTYQRTMVVTEGSITPLAGTAYYVLRQGSAQLLVVPGRYLDSAALDTARFVSRVEVRGVVRKIRPKESVQGKDLDLIEDPTLPPLPAPAFEKGWPRNSITALAIRERQGSDGGRKEGAAPGFAAQVVAEGAAYAGKKLRLIGQFRGRNFFGDLDPKTMRSKEDWILKDGETLFWVTGRPPKGQGWSYDPTYKGDMMKWIEVEGKPEFANGVMYVRASLVLPAKEPIVEK